MSSLWVPPGIAGHQSDSKHRGILGRLLLNREIKSYGYSDENVEIWSPVASLKTTVHLNACGTRTTLHFTRGKPYTYADIWRWLTHGDLRFFRCWIAMLGLAWRTLAAMSPLPSSESDQHSTIQWYHGRGASGELHSELNISAQRCVFLGMGWWNGIIQRSQYHSISTKHWYNWRRHVAVWQMHLSINNIQSLWKNWPWK